MEKFLLSTLFVTVQPFQKMMLTAKTPQYDLPDLRGRQRAQSFKYFFCFPLIPMFIGTGTTEKKHL